jgi:hypothetical protein
MSRRTWIILFSLAALLLGIEVVFRFVDSSRAGIQIVNDGTTAIENLIVSFPGSRVAVGSLAPGESGHVWLSGHEKGTLELSFTQAENPMSGFQIPDYDPQEMRRDGLKMVIHVRPNEVMKYMDDEGSSTPLGRLGDSMSDWITSELDLRR